jgi:hypothetical protein
LKPSKDLANILIELRADLFGVEFVGSVLLELAFMSGRCNALCRHCTPPVTILFDSKLRVNLTDHRAIQGRCNHCSHTSENVVLEVPHSQITEGISKVRADEEVVASDWCELHAFAAPENMGKDEVVRVFVSAGNGV